MKCHFIEQFTEPDEKISIYKREISRLLPRAAPSFDRQDQSIQTVEHRRGILARRRKESQLQRIYGTSFFLKKDLDPFLTQIEEAKNAITACLENSSTCSRFRNWPDRD